MKISLRRAIGKCVAASHSAVGRLYRQLTSEPTGVIKPMRRCNWSLLHCCQITKTQRVNR